MKKFCFSLLLVFPILVFGQLRNADVYKLPEMGKENIRENINIPGFDGYEVLKCDFHIHTVFSDGRVWPDMRVNEAWQQGLDAIAITDHIEYRPFKDMVIGDLNESYKIAKAHADYLGFIVIKGAEVTREKPIGHLNALFMMLINLIKKILWMLCVKLKSKGHSLCGIIRDGPMIRVLYIQFMNNF